MTNCIKCLPKKYHPNGTDTPTGIQVAGAVIPIILAFLIAGLEDQISESNPLVGRTFAMVVLIAGWWLAAPWPMFATSLTPCWLFPLTGVYEGSSVCSSYFNQTIMLILGAFLVDMCIEESGLGSRFGLHMLKLFGNQPVALLAGFCLVAWLLSSICNNTSMTMVNSSYYATHHAVWIRLTFRCDISSDAASFCVVHH